VLSHIHAEIWSENGKIYIKDTKSSSGTFLNNFHLSPAGSESAPHQLEVGDIVQFGINYRGSFEDIYKSVKIRIEVGRDLQEEWIKDNTLRRPFAFSETQVHSHPFFVCSIHIVAIHSHAVTMPTTNYLVITAAQILIAGKVTKDPAVIRHLTYVV
jgi:hypothetical protein